MGHYFLRLKCLMKDRKCSEDSARQALFLMNHCYVGGVVSSWNEPVRYSHSVSSRAIDSCLFSQIDCRCWCNESIAALASVEEREQNYAQAKVICRNYIMCMAQMKTVQNNKGFYSFYGERHWGKCKASELKPLSLIDFPYWICTNHSTGDVKRERHSQRNVQVLGKIELLNVYILEDVSYFICTT